MKSFLLNHLTKALLHIEKWPVLRYIFLSPPEMAVMDPIVTKFLLASINGILPAAAVCGVSYWIHVVQTADMEHKHKDNMEKCDIQHQENHECLTRLERTVQGHDKTLVWIRQDMIR
jgi:hypothetical protein